MDIEHSVTVDKAKLLELIGEARGGAAIPEHATMHISKTKEGQRLVVKWTIEHQAAQS